MRFFFLGSIANRTDELALTAAMARRHALMMFAGAVRVKSTAPALSAMRLLARAVRLRHNRVRQAIENPYQPRSYIPCQNT
jgi:hypothetical protein